MKHGSRRARVVAFSVIVAAGAVVGSSAVPALASSPAPFTDPNAHGYIALCDLAGHNVTSGSVDSTPLVWKAISSTPTPAGYSGAGQNAGLLIYQPRRGVDPGDWNGDLLTAATFYRSKNAPVAEATYRDFSLADFIKEYPSTWDGLYQLRMHFAKRNYGTYTTTYPATTIQVTGSTWHVVDGGTLPCGSARATSSEVQAGISQVSPTKSRTQTPPTAAASQQPAAPSAAQHPTTGARSGRVVNDARIISSALNAPRAASSPSSDRFPIGVAALAGVVLAGLGGAFLSRRRRSGPRP